MEAALDWLNAQRDRMIELLTSWSAINSGSRHLAGVRRMADLIAGEFSSFEQEVKLLDAPDEQTIDSSGNTVTHRLGPVISLRRRPDAPVRVLLNIHYDTVFGADHPFQAPARVDADTLVGPGVVDAKGGLVVLLFALRAVERIAPPNLGWEVLINPDEEIGSPGSVHLLREAAKRNHAGLVFEPATPQGNLIGARKGSGAFTFVIRGRAAHAGRDFHLGRSAILAMVELVRWIDREQRALDEGVIINCGRVEGGGAVNIVPDLAIARFNTRATTVDEQRAAEGLMRRAAEEISKLDGIRVDVHGGFLSPPKPLDERSAKLMELVLATARELGMNLTHQPSGGACDGNKLVAAGLPVVDTMGPVGGELHSEREYVKLDSLVPRAQLAALTLLRLAQSAPE